MARKRNEWARRKPNKREVTAAKKLAKKVSKDLLGLMEADEKKDS